MDVGAVTKSKSQRGEKKFETSVSKPKCVARPRKNRKRDVPVMSNSSESYSADEDYVEFLKTYNPHESYSSGSDEIDADYVEFLKTYDPQESYPQVSSPDDEESQITMESKKQKTPKPLKETSDSE
ncbi:hypothetical protein QL285_027307 [Trifolium repens]|nr:hypothetical protein QL285_027307 [Trifolium repens]